MQMREPNHPETQITHFKKSESPHGQTVVCVLDRDAANNNLIVYRHTAIPAPLTIGFSQGFQHLCEPFVALLFPSVHKEVRLPLLVETPKRVPNIRFELSVIENIIVSRASLHCNANPSKSFGQRVLASRQFEIIPQEVFDVLPRNYAENQTNQNTHIHLHHKSAYKKLQQQQQQP